MGSKYINSTMVKRQRQSSLRRGRGIVNSLINKLPIELHIPGYSYCGPGTQLDKRLQRGDKGINQLDAACKDHDIAYSQSKDLITRHQADKILQHRAWERANSKDAKLGEKTAAWFVTTAMKDENTDYEIGLVSFNSFTTIPNIDESNNLFVWGDKNKLNEFKVPVGAYELDDLISVLKKHMNDKDKNAKIDIIPDINTSKISISSNRIISFNNANSIAQVFGFDVQRLDPGKIYSSNHPVKILKVNSIGIDCSIAAGSYLNGNPVHIIHQFFPTVPSGYKIVESSQNILYYPVSVKTINNITVKIIDQSGGLINFREEEITVTLHIRKV
ncbi:unnamed protein product [Psylliodes chrysocephalus]|uniref:Phospholipase A2-like domain-containing protein n=1 Tax=Psylliodes chrysocephalus TaxID=3402493 RepID=A0A9P0D8B6_9CUCU|nr:unnamed protein product [Psylliodes chrysocephala]